MLSNRLTTLLRSRFLSTRNGLHSKNINTFLKTDTSLTSIIRNMPTEIQYNFLQDLFITLEKEGQDFHFKKIGDETVQILSLIDPAIRLDTYLLIDPELNFLPPTSLPAIQQKMLLNKLGKEKVSNLFKRKHTIWITYLNNAESVELFFDIIGKEKIFE